MLIYKLKFQQKDFNSGETYKNKETNLERKMFKKPNHNKHMQLYLWCLVKTYKKY